MEEVRWIFIQAQTPHNFEQLGSSYQVWSFSKSKAYQIEWKLIQYLKASFSFVAPLSHKFSSNHPHDLLYSWGQCQSVPFGWVYKSIPSFFERSNLPSLVSQVSSQSMLHLQSIKIWVLHLKSHSWIQPV